MNFFKDKEKSLKRNVQKTSNLQKPGYKNEEESFKKMTSKKNIESAQTKDNPNLKSDLDFLIEECVKEHKKLIISDNLPSGKRVFSDSRNENFLYDNYIDKEDSNVEVPLEIPNSEFFSINGEFLQKKKLDQDCVIFEKIICNDQNHNSDENSDFKNFFKRNKTEATGNKFIKRNSNLKSFSSEIFYENEINYKKDSNQIYQTINFKGFKDFPNKIFLKKIKKDKKTFFCPQENCELSFPTLSRVKRHFLIHTNLRPFQCINKGCLKTFSRKDNMQIHALNHCEYILNRYKKY